MVHVQYTTSYPQRDLGKHTIIIRSTISEATYTDIHTKWYEQTNSIKFYLYTTEIKWYNISGFRAFRISGLRIRDWGPLLHWRGEEGYCLEVSNEFRCI
jgi:hypothetical protein